MKKEIALNRMLKVVIVVTIVLIALQYCLYVIREKKKREANEGYRTQHGIVETRL